MTMTSRIENFQKLLERVRESLPDAYPYESEAFHHCWWEELAPKFRIGERSGDWLIHHKGFGPLTLREMRLAGWNNAWSQDLTAERVADCMQFQRETAWDVMRVTWNERRAEHQALGMLEALNMPYLQLPAPPEYLIDLSGGWDDYLKSVSSNARHGLKKKLKKVVGLNPVLLQFPLDGPDAVAAFFKLFFEAHLPYWDQKVGRSYFHDVEERRFIVAWAKELAASGQLLLHGAQFNGEWVNLGMSVLCGDTMYWLLTINTGRYLECSPGMVALALQLKDAISRGVRLFNMGSGDYFYKIQMSNRVDAGHQLLMVNPQSLRGRVYGAWLQRRLQRQTDDSSTRSGC